MKKIFFDGKELKGVTDRKINVINKDDKNELLANISFSGDFIEIIYNNKKLNFRRNDIIKLAKIIILNEKRTKRLNK